MTRWFRVYDDLLCDFKCQSLTPARFKMLINLWCVASKNGGALPPVADICYHLRMRKRDVTKAIEFFKENNFLDESEGVLKPHNWDKRQYKTGS